MQFPVIVGLHRSHFLDMGLAVVALLATGAALAFPRAALIQLAIVTIIWIFAGIAWKKLSPTLSALRLERSGQIFIRRGGEDEFLLAELSPGATIHPWLSVFMLKPSGDHVCTVIATVDSIKQQDFRRLRMFLRWQADFSAPTDDV